MSTFKTTGARLLLMNFYCTVNLLNPNIHIQYRLTLQINIFPANLENFFKDQSISPLVIILFILITFTLGDINKDMDISEKIDVCSKEFIRDLSRPP